MKIAEGNRVVFALWALAATLAALLLTDSWRDEGCPAENPVTSLHAKGAYLTVEVAADNASRHCGLAFRNELPPGRGMLFAFEDEQRLQFWMKDTNFPLAIAYIGADRKIREIRQMQPNSQGRVYESHRPAKYALETRPGWFETNSIGVGDRVEFALPDGLAVD